MDSDGLVKSMADMIESFEQEMGFRLVQMPLPLAEKLAEMNLIIKDGVVWKVNMDFLNERL